MKNSNYKVANTVLSQDTIIAVYNFPNIEEICNYGMPSQEHLETKLPSTLPNVVAIFKIRKK